MKRLLSLIKIIKLKYNGLKNYRFMSLRRLYKHWEQNQLKKIFEYCDVECVFDIGANYGQYALMLRSKLKYRGLIISFEPIPEAAAKLRELSADDPLWIVEECAISSCNGEQTFSIMNDSQFSSLSEPQHSEVGLYKEENKLERKISVKTETLDSAFDRLKGCYNLNRPFLKMDTQGFDTTIISHSKSAVKQFVGLQSELAIKKLYKDSVDFREAITLYENCGFSLSAFVSNNAGSFPRLIEIDCIMVRSDLLDNAGLLE